MCLHILPTRTNKEYSNFAPAPQAIDALLGGAHVVVCTSTASGKSVCYSVPILEALAADPEACALFMFPTKALAQVGVELGAKLGTG